MRIGERRIYIDFKIKGEDLKRFLKIINYIVSSPAFLIFIILIFALFLRLYFFIGFAGGDPQDDGIYLNIAKGILQKGFCDHNVQKRVILNNEMVNPVYIFPSRVIFNYLNVISFSLFGISDYSASLFTLICSLLGIYFVYKIGIFLFDYRVGLLSSFFLAIMPLDAIYATRITPDIPVAFFMTLGIYLFLKGFKQDKGIWMFAAGVVVGLGYLVKSTAMMGLLYMFLWIIVSWIKEKIFSKKVFFILLGLMIVFVIEGLYYKIAADYFFLRLHLIAKVYKSKYGDEWLPFVAQFDLKWVLIEYPVRTVLRQLKTMLGLFHHRPELSYFGYFYYPIILSFFYLLFKKIYNRSFIIAWFLLIYLFVEFGPIEINFGWDPLIKYGLIEKQPRYLTIILAPSVILLSLFLVNARIPFKKAFILIVIFILSMNSYKSISSAHQYFRGHTYDLREATNYLIKLPEKKVFVDRLGMDQIYFYSGFTNKNLRNIDAIARNPTKSSFSDSYVVVGGARGSGVIAVAFEKDYFALLKQIPHDWIVLKSIPGERDVFRHRNLTIYYIPG